MRSRSPTGNAVNGIFPMLFYACGGIIGVATTCYIERWDAGTVTSQNRVGIFLETRFAPIATLSAYILRRCCLQANPLGLVFWLVFLSARILRLRNEDARKASNTRRSFNAKKLTNGTYSSNFTVRKSYQTIRSDGFSIEILK